MFESIIITNCKDENVFLEQVRINGLLQYNMEKTGGKLRLPDIEILKVAKDENGLIIGGISASTFLSALEVEVLWVKESHRGQEIASRLLSEAEEEARKAGCRLAFLTTYSFQALGFYKKQGYAICGEVSGFPDDIKLFTLQKQL